MSQAVEHRIHHIVDLDEQATVNADMIHHSPTEGFINPPIRYYIQTFHLDTCVKFVNGNGTPRQVLLTYDCNDEAGSDIMPMERQ